MVTRYNLKTNLKLKFCLYRVTFFKVLYLIFAPKIFNFKAPKQEFTEGKSLYKQKQVLLTFPSGAEDNHGYLWDRHYGVCLTKFPHTDVVNSVAFNPKDPEMLVTTSDDNTIKIWRSRAKVNQLNLNEAQFQRGVEVRKGRAKRTPTYRNKTFFSM